VPTPNFLVKKEVEGDYQVAAPAESRTPNNYDRLSDNALYIKVKRMVCLLDRSRLRNRTEFLHSTELR
jgi:hypothetical protein